MATNNKTFRIVGLAACICMWQACRIWGADTPSATAPTAPVRLAVLAADGSDETAALADLLTVQFTQTPGVETVERTELDRVLREQALTAAGLADEVAGRISIGRLLRADGFLFVARTATGRQRSARLVEARRGFQVFQMLYGTNETPATVAEHIAGAVTAKLPTLRLTDEQRILLNVMRLGNATGISRAGWIESDGVLQLAIYLAAHPAVLTVERRELGSLHEEHLLVDGNSPAFHGCDFLIDGDVFLTADSDHSEGEHPVTLVLRIRDMHLAEHARATRDGLIGQLDEMLLAAAAELLEKLSILRPQIQLDAASLEAQFLRKSSMHAGFWAAEAAYALDDRDESTRRELLSRLLTKGGGNVGPVLDSARHLARAASLLLRYPELLDQCRFTSFNIAGALDYRYGKGYSVPPSSAAELEVMEILRPVRAITRIELERFLVPNVELYPQLWRNIHCSFESEREALTYVQALAERNADDVRIDLSERRKRTAVLLGHSTLAPRLYEKLCMHDDPVIRFFAYANAARVSASADERGRLLESAVGLLPEALRDQLLSSFVADWSIRHGGFLETDYPGVTIGFLHKSNNATAGRVVKALLSHYEELLEAGKISEFCDNWRDKYLGCLDQSTIDTLVERFQAVRQSAGARLPKSKHGLAAMTKLDDAWALLVKSRQKENPIASGDRLVMLDPRDPRLPALGYPLNNFTFAITPQRLFMDGDHLWIAVGGHDYNSPSRKIVDVTGLLRMDLGNGNIESLGMYTHQQDWTTRGIVYSKREYNKISPLFFWGDSIGVAKRGLGIILFRRTAQGSADRQTNIRLIDNDCGLPSTDITGTVVLNDVLYIALPKTLLAWPLGDRLPCVVAATATETASGPLAEAGLIEGLAFDPANQRLYLFEKRTIWRHTPADGAWVKLISNNRRVNTRRDEHGIMTGNQDLVLFAKSRASKPGGGSSLIEGFVDITGCFRLGDEAIDEPPPALRTPGNYLARYDIASYLGGTIVVGGDVYRSKKKPAWELAYLVSDTNAICGKMIWTSRVPDIQSYSKKSAKSATEEAPSESDPFFAAVLANDSATVTRLLDAGRYIDEYCEHFNTPLMHAAASGQADILNTLLAKGADIEVPSGNGETALMIAARNNRLRCVNLLLAAGADPNSRDNRNFPCVMGVKDPGVLRALIEAGADPVATFGGQDSVTVFNFFASSTKPTSIWITDMLRLGTIPGALDLKADRHPIRPQPSQAENLARIDHAFAQIRHGEEISNEERHRCLAAFARFYNEMCRKHQFTAAQRFAEPDRTEYYLQAVKMSFIDWQRHGGWAFRSDIREAVFPEIEKRLEAGPFDPYLAFCTLFRKVQRGDTEAARRDFERIATVDPFLAQHVIQWCFRNYQQVDWLINPYLANGKSNKVRQLAILASQVETPEMLKIAADFYRRIGDQKEADALLARAATLETK